MFMCDVCFKQKGAGQPWRSIWCLGFQALDVKGARIDVKQEDISITFMALQISGESYGLFFPPFNWRAYDHGSNSLLAPYKPPILWSNLAPQVMTL